MAPAIGVAEWNILQCEGYTPRGRWVGPSMRLQTLDSEAEQESLLTASCIPANLYEADRASVISFPVTGLVTPSPWLARIA